MRTFRHSVVDDVLRDVGVDLGSDVAADTRAFVDGQIARMPAHLRIGVLGVETLLAIGPRRSSGGSSRAQRWASSRLFPIASYGRLIRGLVLFASHEFIDARR